MVHYFSSGIYVGMYGLTYSLYCPRVFNTKETVSWDITFIDSKDKKSDPINFTILLLLCPILLREISPLLADHATYNLKVLFIYLFINS